MSTATNDQEAHHDYDREGSSGQVSNEGETKTLYSF